MNLVLDFESEAIAPRPEYPPKPVGLAVHYDPQISAHYYNWGHPNGRNTLEVTAADYTQTMVSGANEITFHNAAFDCAILEERWGTTLPWDKVQCTMIMAFLANPFGELRLKPLSAQRLGIPPAEQDDLRDWLVRNVPKATPKNFGAYIALAPGAIVEPYATGDVIRTKALYDSLKPEIEARGMMPAYRRELRLMPHILEAERQGLLVDVGKLEDDIILYDRTMDQLDARICDILHADVDVDSDRDLAKAIKAAGLAPDGFPLTEKGNEQTNKQAIIDSVRHPELAGLLLIRSSIATCVRTFIRPWLIQARKYGRIYNTWNQVRNYSDTGARTGRLSSTPNLQNMPTEWEKLLGQLKAIGFDIESFGVPLPLIRSCIIAEPGHLLAGRDFSSQELRILAHFEDGSLQKAYKDNPRLDPHQWAADMAGITRKEAKTLFFSILYGAGARRIAEQLGCSIGHAGYLKKMLMDAVPGIAQLQRSLKQCAASGKPYVTLGGREYYCEPPKVIEGRHRTFEYKMLNYLIQGSAADYTKEAVIRYCESAQHGKFMISVHDELLIMVPEDHLHSEMLLLKNAMEGALPLDVPMLSDGEIGRDWAHMEPYTDV